MKGEVADRVTRRRALTVIAAATAGLAGCPGGSDSETAQPTPGPNETATPPDTDAPTESDVPTAPPTENPRFETVVDVADAGAATDGSASITDLVQQYADDDTALIFPDGRYALEPLVLSGLENFAMRAAPDADPVLVPAGPAAEVGKYFLQLTSVDRLLFEGFTFDFTEAGYGGMTYVLGTGDFTFRNVTVDGPVPADTSGFRFDVVERDSEGMVEDVIIRDGSEPDSTSVGIYVGSDHAGTLTFRNCEVANFPNNGLYASSPGREDALAGANGPVHVEGGFYRNNNVANVRLGSTGSYVKDATVVVDEVPPDLHGEMNARGIRFRARGGHLVENCEVRIEPPEVTSLGGIVVHRACRNVRVRNTDVTVESDGVPAINLLRPSNGVSSSAFENVTVMGGASEGDGIRIRQRDGTTFQNCTVDQPGQKRNGVRFRDSHQCALQHSTISATAEPLVSVESSVSTTDTRLNDLNREKATPTGSGGDGSDGTGGGGGGSGGDGTNGST